jgi:UDP-3-O-[3-hydroxymyristoyl] glucosamine N-acyltransferase
LAFALTLSELARRVDGVIVRTGHEMPLTGMAALDAAGPGDISFLGNEKYHRQFLETKAGAVIVPQGVADGPAGTALVAVENPTLAFSAVVRHFAAETRKFEPGIDGRAIVDPSASFNPLRVRIHPGAVIMAGAVIGDGSEIGPSSVIGEAARIGPDSRLHANIHVYDRCVIGARAIIHSGAVIGSDGYGYEFSEGRHLKIDQVGIVEIGDDVEIGANTTIDRARFGKTLIGDGTKIDNLVQIGHNVVIGKHCLIVAQTGISGSSRLGDYVTVAGQVGIAGHVTIGDRAVLTARTGVTADLPGGETYAGKPAQPLRDELKFQAHVRRIPKLVERVKAMENSR